MHSRLLTGPPPVAVQGSYTVVGFEVFAFLCYVSVGVVHIVAIYEYHG